MMARIYDKILAGAAAVVLLALVGWFVLQQGTISEITSEPISVTLSNTAYEPQVLALPSSAARTWSDPTANAAQPEWVFDVFTPPVIYYNRVSKEFTVTPPDYSETKQEDVVVAPPPFGVELIEVRRDPFRLQLVGYAGGEGNYLGMFENVATGDTVLGRAGKTFVDLGLTVLSLDVKKERIELPDSMPIVQTVAEARVLDIESKEEIDLTSSARRATGSPSVVLRIVETGEERTEKAGADFEAGGYRYHVDDLDETIGTATLTRTSAEESAETVTETLGIAVTGPIGAGDSEAAVPEEPPPPAATFPGF